MNETLISFLCSEVRKKHPSAKEPVVRALDFHSPCSKKMVPSAAEPVDETLDFYCPPPIDEAVSLSITSYRLNPVSHPCSAELRQCFFPPKYILKIKWSGVLSSR